MKHKIKNCEIECNKGTEVLQKNEPGGEVERGRDWTNIIRRR